MASEEQKQEIDDKVTALVANRFGGDYRAAFAHYDADGNGTIDKDELKVLLKDAGIGSGLTRWAWAKGIMGEVDTSGDGAISWEEFEAVFRSCREWKCRRGLHSPRQLRKWHRSPGGLPCSRLHPSGRASIVTTSTGCWR